jgi:DNA mismatch repair ATPase MutS
LAVEQVSIISILSIVIPSLSAILSTAYATYRIGKKFGEIGERFKAIDKRFEYVDKRFDELKKYVDSRFNELKSYVDDKFSELRSYVDYKVDRLGKAFSSYQEFFIEYLSVKGVVSEQEATMLKNEAARLSTLATANPFTKEEWDKLKKYLEKDPKEFTLKEAEEFRELGRKAIVEYGDRPEAYKLHLYTCVVYGLTLRRVYEEREKKKKQIEQQQSS